MKIFVTGSLDRIDEFRKIIPASHQLFVSNYESEKNNPLQDLSSYDLIGDLNLDENPDRINLYSNLKGKVVIVGAVKNSLKTISAKSKSELLCHLIGFNALPTFINREKKEISFLDTKDKMVFSKFARELNWKWLEVKDAAGMVSARVISMIVNEACFALEEGTASKEDIDKGMKLGTAYPFGPLEWTDRIGIKNIYDSLLAFKNESKDNRYTISVRLKSMCQKGEKFYN